MENWIKSPLKNKLMMINWLTWSWKSFFACYLSSFYERIICNFSIFYEWEKINESINTMLDIQWIDYSPIKWVCIIDESWLNINARRWMSQTNLDFIELSALSRKKNIDIIVISQVERMIDVVVRELCRCSFEMQSYFIWKDYLMFDITVQNRNWNLVKKISADLFKFTQKYHWTYDTKENSKIEKNNNKKIDWIIESKNNYNNYKNDLF